MSKISVIVPVYKVEKYLDRCIESILAQTFTDFELILVDDGSLDNCPKICDEWAKKDNRIVVIHQKNGGLSAARNAGIDWAFSNSDSEWLTFIDSDDWVHTMFLEILLYAAESSNSDISVCGFKEIKTEDEPLDIQTYNYNTFMVENFFCAKHVNAVIAWAKMYKKYLFQDIKYPIGKINEDEFTTYKLLYKYKKIPFVDLPLYNYFYNREGITKNNKNQYKFDRKDALEEQYHFFFNNNYQNSLNHIVPIYFASLFNYILFLQKHPSKNHKLIKINEKKINQLYQNYKYLILESSPAFHEMYIDYKKHRIHRFIHRIFRWF